ncbi:MAG: F0F1 ATP synthase subunit epsilon, partial [Actinomycetota bacterium]|nr:F0F1 ATP synthase subunit epsilon [Actinomycetota bacterium]
MATLQVELVSVEASLWSGTATSVTARTTEGEIGILPGHTPLLGELAEGFTVTVHADGATDVVAAVHGGFLSVTPELVTVLAEVAELSETIDAGRARAALD